MDGSSWINKQAARKRALAVRKGSFRESSFHYLGMCKTVFEFNGFKVSKISSSFLRLKSHYIKLQRAITGETLLLWDVKQYMSNSKWRDDALRRSRKNRELLSMGNKKGISRPQKKGSRKQRFEKVWAEILLQNKVECETTRS